MRDFLDQADAAAKARLYYVALLAALAIPDVCGAMEAADGLATKPRYVSWFDRYVASRYRIGSQTTFSGEDVYYFRCERVLPLQL